MSELEDDVRELVERQAIVDVINDYCHYVDLKDFDTMVEKVWAPDGSDAHGERLVKGREAIRDWYEREGTSNLSSNVHAISNVMVQRDGERATMISLVLSWAWTKETDGAGPLRPADYATASRYNDELSKYPEGWRIDRRFVTPAAESVIAIGAVPESQRHLRARAAKLDAEAARR
jgi:hypothetical protein